MLKIFAFLCITIYSLIFGQFPSNHTTTPSQQVSSPAHRHLTDGTLGGGSRGGGFRAFNIRAQHHQRVAASKQSQRESGEASKRATAKQEKQAKQDTKNQALLQRFHAEQKQNAPSSNNKHPEQKRQEREEAKQYKKFNNEDEAGRKAAELGYVKTNYKSERNAVIYRKGNIYITRDTTSHKGGAWKASHKPKGFNKTKTRIGTFDKDMNKIGD